MTDDDPLDLAQVAADHDAVECLRTSRLAAGADGRDDDAGLLLLRDLLRDVRGELPEPLPLPVPAGRGSTVLTLAGGSDPQRRLARHGALVAVFTAGLVSLTGVAAASTMLPPGTPLHSLGAAVRSAAGAVVGAVSPPEPAVVRPEPARTATSAPTPAPRTATAPVEGKPAPGQRAPQQQAPQQQAPKQEAPKQEAPQRQAPQRQAPQRQAPQRQAPQQQPPKQQPPKQQPPKQQPAKQQPPKQQAPAKGAADPPGSTTRTPSVDVPAAARAAQLSRDASTKPRA
jgi:hypothetical protein